MKFILMSLPLLLGFIIDCFAGDPYTMPHPVRAIGRLISFTEDRLRRRFRGREAAAGRLLVIIVSGISFLAAAAVCALCYKLNFVLGIIAEGVLCYYLIAARCLRDESMKVYRALQNDDTEGARLAVSMIVGRDTDVLDRDGIIRAAVETVAENTSDGVTAPIFYMALGGAPLGFFYKAVNTMDSMVGYKNEKYLWFGRGAAKLDDLLNFVPSRLSALAMTAAAYILEYDGKNALAVWKRDRRKHASPNSAQTESACAGALNVRLAGDAYYFGELHRKEFIGDDIRKIEPEDIVRANRLMYVTSVICLIFGVMFKAAVGILVYFAV